jgi:hypothetical protein
MGLISMLSTNQLVATTPTPAINENRYFFIIKSPLRRFRKPASSRRAAYFAARTG